MRDAIAWYFSKTALPLWCVFILDCLIVLFSDYTIHILNNGLAATVRVVEYLALAYGFYLLFYIIGFRLFHTYDGVLRYSSLSDLQRVGFAVVVGLALTALCKYIFHSDDWLFPIRMRDIVLASLLSVVLMWAVRFLAKFLHDSALLDKHAKRVFIYGVKTGGIGLANSIKAQGTEDFAVVGFVSDEKNMSKRRLLGVKVFPNDENLASQMLSRRAQALFVSPLQNEAIRNNPQMADRLIRAGIKIYKIPSAERWDGKSNIDHRKLREVDIEDLLPREKIEIDLGAVGKLLREKSILITGAAGSIGSEIVRQTAQFSPQSLILIDQAETPLHDLRLMLAESYKDIHAETIVCDICNLGRMESIVAKHKPDYVFHAAAYKHVPMMENNPAESISNNVLGTKVIADLAVKYSVKKFVMVSTDKAVNPTNVMGCSKRICEIYVQSLDKAIKEGAVQGSTQFVTTRFGNVLGSNGSVIPLFKEQIKRGGPVLVTHKDIVRYFMLIPEACKLVLEAGALGNGGEIFVFDMGKPVKIVDLARRMIRLSGVEDVEIKFTGLRDGEKLYEEVLSDAETTKPTIHPKIKIARVREYEYADVCRQIENLISASKSEDDMSIVRQMKQIVPEFKSTHSVYEVLDK